MLDFTSENNEKWVGEQLRKFPEIIKDGFIPRSDMTDEMVSKVISGSLNLITKPGKPKQEKDKKGRIKKVDWDAWFLYYCLCDLFGFKTSYEEIGQEVGRDRETVKQNFYLVQLSLD